MGLLGCHAGIYHEGFDISVCLKIGYTPQDMAIYIYIYLNRKNDDSPGALCFFRQTHNMCKIVLQELV